MLTSSIQPGPTLPPQPKAVKGAEGQIGSSAPPRTGAPVQASSPPVHESQPAQKVIPADLKSAAAVLQSHVSQVAPELQFSVDKDSGRSIITITDTTTNKVIKQIPSEAALSMAKEIDQFQKQHGLLLDRKV